MPRPHLLKKLALLCFVFVLVGGVLPAQNPVAAQGDDAVAEIERLAADVHIQNVRAGRGY